MLQTSPEAVRPATLRPGPRSRSLRPHRPDTRTDFRTPGIPGARPAELTREQPVPGSRWRRLTRRLRNAIGNEEGAATAEYAVVIMAAVGFAGLLVIIMQSDEVRGFLLGLVQRALGSAG